MNETTDLQFHLDFRTGRPTAIPDAQVSAAGRSACAALNRERVRGLTEADRSTASRESLPPHVWATAFARRCAEWSVPLIPLAALGITHDNEKLSDLHQGNIMRDSADAPTIIDALVSSVPPAATRRFRWLAHSVEDAQIWRPTGSRPLRKAFDDVNDDDL